MKTLEKIKLTVTPRRFAIQYLSWMHDSIGESLGVGDPKSAGPCPYQALLRKMNLEIQKEKLNSTEVRLRAEKETLFLISTYATSARVLINNLLVAQEFHLMVLPFVDPPGFCPQLVSWLNRIGNELVISMASLEKIERELSGLSVIPSYYRSLYKSLSGSIQLTLEPHKRSLFSCEVRSPKAAKLLLAYVRTTRSMAKRMTKPHILYKWELHAEEALLFQLLRYQAEFRRLVQAALKRETLASSSKLRNRTTQTTNKSSGSRRQTAKS